MPSNYITQEQAQAIQNSLSVLDYFKHLQAEGKVQFQRKTGHDYYFVNKDHKYSVTPDNYYDFKEAIGGQLIKAVMQIENKTWLEAMGRLAELAQMETPSIELSSNSRQRTSSNQAPKLTKIAPVSNTSIINYFASRGIEPNILKAYTSEINYTLAGKNYYGIGINNNSNGYEVRNPYMKTKLRTNDYSTVHKATPEAPIIVVEGMTDALSYLQLLEDNEKEPEQTVVSLNSITNAQKFIANHKQAKNKIYLLLDGDQAGNKATQQIKAAFPPKQTKDIRHLYNIRENGHNDLNDYLQDKRRMALAQKPKQLEDIHTIQERISSIQRAINRNRFWENPESTDATIINKAVAEGLLNKLSATQVEWKEEALKSMQNRIARLRKEININYTKNQNNGHQQTQPKATEHNGSTTVSRTESVGTNNADHTPQQLSNGGQPEQENNNQPRSTVSSNTTGDGSVRTKPQSTGHRQGSGDTASQPSKEPELFKAASKRQNGGNISGGLPYGRGSAFPSLNEYIKSLAYSAINSRDNAQTNRLIGQIINFATATNDEEVVIKDGVRTSNPLKEALLSYKNGGTLKNGRGVLDEYYTPTSVVAIVKEALKLAQLQKQITNNKKLRVLEPSIGTGTFIQSLSGLTNPNIDITGFETNPITAGIAKLINPQATILNQPFETLFINDTGKKEDKANYENTYDLVIGNPPYGKHRGFYKGLGEMPNVSRYEDYFVRRSLDVLKQGGTLAMVLPSSWIDRQDKLEEATLKEAWRLPNGTFKSTDIGTDIVILQKAEKGHEENIANYFKNNPNRILGELAERTNRFGREETYVKGALTDAIEIMQDYYGKELEQNKQIAEEAPKKEQFIGDLFSTPEEAKLQDDPQHKEKTNPEPDISKDVKETTQALNMAIAAINNVTFKSPTLKNKQRTFIDAIKELQKNPAAYDNAALKEAREQALKQYQALQKNREYTIQTRPDISKKILKYQFNKQDEIVKASQQNQSEQSPQEMAAFADTNYDGTLQNPEQHKQYASFYNGKWVNDFYYVEGDIYEKLDQLELDANQFPKNITKEQLEKQRNLLLDALPQPKDLDQIIISPNHEFVHSFKVGVREEMRPNEENRLEKVMVAYSLADRFLEFARSLSDTAFQTSSYWEVREYVDNQTVTGSDRDRNNLIRQRRKHVANDLFQKFLHQELSQEIKEKFVHQFNRKYNNIHIPDYSKFPLFGEIHKNFKGAPLQLTEVQKAGIGRLTTKGVGLLAHEVGFGKTLSGTLAIHEALHRGNAKRPLIVVPNDNILKQWAETIFETIPEAKVNILGNLGTKYDLSNFRVNDGDITLVTYSGFNNIGFSNEITKELADKFSYITEHETRGIKHTAREEELEKAKREEVHGTMKRGKIYSWEDFGFDHLTFDEVQNANHIVSKVRIESRSFASDFRSQQQRTSQLGINTWMAAQYIQQNNNGRNVTLLSATPFTNKPLEYYSILSLIANKRLEAAGYFNVNNFFDTFMEADNEMEINAQGEPKYKMSVRRFKNNTLFQQLLSEYIDIKGENDNPQLVRPNRLNKEYKIEQNDFTKNEYEKLNQSFDPQQDGAILTHILNARLTAISPYLSPEYEGPNPNTDDFINNSPKLKLTLDLIHQNAKDNPSAGQIIYSELAVDQFPRIKDYMVKNNVLKEDEIGIITGKTSKNNRIKIQNDFNDGKIKVVLGSSAIQEGMNLQKNSTDMFILSLPYNFTSLRQVEGRLWRQGNKWPNVRINYMLTNDSIDVFMLQKLQAKQARYIEAMRAGADILDISDISTKDLKTALITNPTTRAEIEIKLMEKQLDGKKQQLMADNAFVLRKYKSYTEVIEKLKRAQESKKTYENYMKEDPKSTWWESSLARAKQEVQKVQTEMENAKAALAKKGVNVENITSQTKSTEKEIADIDKQIEDLPLLKVDLIDQYEEEKAQRETDNSFTKFIAERHEDNKNFYSTPKPEIKMNSNITKQKNQGEKNQEFLAKMPSAFKDKIITEIAKHYQRTTDEIKSEIQHPEAEAIYEYLPSGTTRQTTYDAYNAQSNEPTEKEGLKNMSKKKEKGALSVTKRNNHYEITGNEADVITASKIIAATLTKTDDETVVAKFAVAEENANFEKLHQAGYNLNINYENNADHEKATPKGYDLAANRVAESDRPQISRGR